MRSWPRHIRAQSVDVSRRRNDLSVESPGTRARQIVRRGLPLWQTRLSFAVHPRNVSEVRYQLEMLDGGAGSVLIDDPSYTRTSTLTILANGDASALAQSLPTDGWPISTSNVVRAGQYVQVGNRLYVLSSSGSSNGSGQVTLQFTTPLTDAVADNEVVTISHPGVVMRAADTDWRGSRSADQGYWRIDLDLIEQVKQQ